MRDDLIYFFVVFRIDDAICIGVRGDFFNTALSFEDQKEMRKIALHWIKWMRTGR